MLELSDFPRNPHSATVNGGGSDRSESPTRTRPLGRVFQLLATVYAVAMLVVTVNVYTRNEEHPGLALLFIACTASFYIICYYALALEKTLKLWLEQHYPTLRKLSIVVAVVLATIPVGILYFLQPKATSSAALTAKLQVAAASPAVATKTVTTETAPAPSAIVPIGKVKTPVAAVANVEPIRVLRDVQYRSGPSSTTVAIDVDENVQYQVNRLAGPDRIYLDLRGSTLDAALWGRKFQVSDARLRAIRVAEHEGQVTRVTLETYRYSEYSVTPEPNSHRLLIELRNAPGQS